MFWNKLLAVKPLVIVANEIEGQRLSLLEYEYS